MFTRSVPVCLAMSLLMACGPAAVVATDTPVFLRGFEVTREHIVFGAVDRAAGDGTTINLGYAHGVQPGNVFLVVRPFGDDVLPVAGLRVVESYPDHSHARVEGPFRVRAGDFLLIRADRLDLWSPLPRADQLMMKRLARLKISNGYDTLNLSPALIDEVSRDDEFQQRMRGVRDVGQFVGEALRRTDPHASRAGAVRPVPILSSREQEQQQASTDPTVVGLTRFVEQAKTPDVIRGQLTLDRLIQMTPVDKTVPVTEGTETNFRQVLLAWMRQVLPAPTASRAPSETPPEEDPAVPGAGAT